MERQPLTEFLSIRRPLTPSYLSSLADVTTSANFAIAVCSRPARPRFHISKDLGRPRSGDVAAFLGKTRAIQAVTRRQARLVFALDATASREATWEHARRLHGELFDAASTATSLAVQLCYYRGIGEFRASRWLTESGALLDQMSRVTCEAGVTQIGRVLTHALEAGVRDSPHSCCHFRRRRLRGIPRIPPVHRRPMRREKKYRYSCFRREVIPPLALSFSGWRH